MNATADITALKNANKTNVKSWCESFDSNVDGYNPSEKYPNGTDRPKDMSYGCCVSCSYEQGIYDDSVSSCVKKAP